MNEKNIDLNKIVQPLLQWYDENKRDLPWRHDPTPYRVWISEIMLQQTRVDPVIPYYLRFMEALPDVKALASAPEDHLMKLWEGLGYYSRARNLQKAAKIIVKENSFPDDFDGWLSLPGIGEYTAGAICSIVLGLPTPAVDGNVLRVLSRVIGSYDDIAAPSVKRNFTEELKKVYPLCHTSEFTQSLMELGAIVCLPNGAPLCDQCPLQELCTASKEQLIDEIPVKTSKKKRKIEQRTVLLLRCDDKLALNRRPGKGLLANLWEYPNRSSHLSLSELEEFCPRKIKRLSDSTHIFTHIEWQMIGYELWLDTQSDEFHWMTIDDVLAQKAIPSAFRCYTNYLKDQRYEE